MSAHRAESAYEVGRSLTGWCCMHCHRTHQHFGKPRRTWLRFRLHRLVRHGLIKKPVGGRGHCCYTSHYGTPSAVTWITPMTLTWSSSYTYNGGNAS